MRSVRYRSEVCTYCPPEMTVGADPKLIPFDCHILVGGGSCAFGTDDDDIFDVHVSLRDRLLYFTIKGSLIENAQYVSIALLQPDKPNDPARSFAASREPPEARELFRKPHDPRLPPPITGPARYFAILDDEPLIGSIVSNFLVTTLMPASAW